MALSFPYPTLMVDARPIGNGCVGSCVHRGYCPAFYWLRRYQQREDVQNEHLGTGCGSWSNNPADRIIGNNADDIAQNKRLNDEGLLVEPDNSGLIEPITGAPWRNEA
jgi:hypothetical protein